jgi:hypothetical protein
LHQIFQAFFKQFRCIVVERKKWFLHMRQLISQHGSFRWYNPSTQKARSKKYINHKNVQFDYNLLWLLNIGKSWSLGGEGSYAYSLRVEGDFAYIGKRFSYHKNQLDFFLCIFKTLLGLNFAITKKCTFQNVEGLLQLVRVN